MLMPDDSCHLVLMGDRRRRKNGHAVDALASSADEGRGQLRKASGSWNQALIR